MAEEIIPFFQATLNLFDKKTVLFIFYKVRLKKVAIIVRHCRNFYENTDRQNKMGQGRHFPLFF